MSTRPKDPSSPRISGFRQWAIAFLGFFLVFGAWSFAAPFDGPADEVQHVIRAAGAVSGQIAPKPVIIPNWNGKGAAGMGAMQKVPEGLWSPATCWGFDPGKTAECARPISGGELKNVPTSAGRYHPLYYLAVGLPVRLWPGWGGLVLARLISAALSAAMLAFAFVCLLRWSRFGLMLGALLACCTPMLAHLAGAVNPNGLEIAAGIAFFSAAIPLIFGAVNQRRAQLVWVMGVSGVGLATLRSLGPVWFAAGLAALLVPQGRDRLKQLWSHRVVKGWTIGLSVGLALSAAWIIIMKTGDVVAPGGSESYNYGTGQATLMYFHRWGSSYLQGMVGVGGWFDIRMPETFYWIWIGCAAALLFFALIVGNWTERWRLFVMFVGGFGVPCVLQVAQANLVGFIIGGRYMLPIMVGMVLYSAYILEQKLLTAKHSFTINKAFCLLLPPVHLVLLWYAMVRWQRGAHGDPQLSWLNPFVGKWHPPTGSVAPIVIMVAGIGLMVVTFWAAAKHSANHPVENQAPAADGEMGSADQAGSADPDGTATQVTVAAQSSGGLDELNPALAEA